MDAVCFSYDFLSLGLMWIIQLPTLIHVYLDIVWETKYHPHFYKIFHEIILPIPEEVFGRKAPRLSGKSNRDLKLIFKFLVALSILIFCLFLSYISYQTIGNGLTKVLKDGKRTIWPPFPISCGTYTLENFKHS